MFKFLDNNLEDVAYVIMYHLCEEPFSHGNLQSRAPWDLRATAAFWDRNKEFL